MSEKITEEQAIQGGCHLFQVVYHKEINEEILTHKHLNNPFRIDCPYLLEYADGQPVAMRWMMRVPLQYQGKPIPAIQSSDDAVDPQARGLLFLKLRKTSQKVMREYGAVMEYGCFYPGEAMEIALKLGFQNVVNLHRARYYVKETKRRWKRFDIPIPTPLAELRYRRRMRALRALAADVEITTTDTCPFTEEDYAAINADPAVCVTRSAVYYDWKLKYKQNMVFVTARKEGKLIGFVLLQRKENTALVADWDVLTDDNDKPAVLAALLLPVCREIAYVDIPFLNTERGEMRWFTQIGCKDLSRLWGADCICAQGLSDAAKDMPYDDASRWKHRLIDADFFLNEV